MNNDDVQEWGKALETSELSPITANLPEMAPPGTPFDETGIDGVQRKWLRVSIIAGNSGARWAYWAPWKASGVQHYGIGPHPEFKAIADGIFNGDAAHFIGMLGVPYAKIPGDAVPAWVLVSPRVAPPRPVRVPEEKSKERYELSKEVYDVETHVSTKLP